MIVTVEIPDAVATSLAVRPEDHRTAVRSGP